MNKDRLLLRFRCERDAFGEEKAVEQEWLSGLRPIGYTTLDAFLERRRAPKHRKHIAELLEQAGCDTLEGFLRVTHGLSLNDTFWVREAGSDLNWDAVSLYQNPFDEVISIAAFDGVISSTELSSTSPEYGTDGRYAKCWVREDSQIFLYKSGSDTYELEPLSEFLATQVAKLICKDYVPYDMGFYHGRLVSKCPLFTTEQIGLAKVSDLQLPDRSIAGLLGYYESIGSGDAFRRMCILDALILNVDRHLGNFGVLFDTDTMEVLGAAPVYDHNRSLLFDLDEDQLQNPDWYIRKCSPRIGVDFLSTARGLLTEELRQELAAIQGFRFQQHPHIHADNFRLEQLSKIVNRQISEILK
jgi:hypothetical protein